MSNSPQGGHCKRSRDGRPVQHSSRSGLRGSSYRSNNASEDGGQGSSTPQKRPREYTKRVGTATQDGTDFEIKMCALVFLRAVQSNSIFTNFIMRSNDPDSGDFDDIVFSYGSPGNENKILVQLKTSKRPINVFSPPKTKSKSLKSLKDYFQNQTLSKTSAYSNKCSYVLFTNADVKLKPRVATLDSPEKELLCTTWKPEDVCQVDLTDDICRDFRNDTGAEDFVNKLFIFRNQCGPIYLDELIKQELIKMCNGFVPKCQTIQQTFVERIKVWWKEETKIELDENWKEWLELKQQLLGQNTLLKQIKFCEDALSDVEQRVLGSKSNIILFKSNSAEVQIACSKVCQTFIRNECLRVLFTDISESQSSQNMLYSLWSKDVYDVMVITDVTNRCQNLGDDIRKHKGNPENRNNKKIVIVTSRDADKLKLSQVLEFGTHVIKSAFNQLVSKSQQDLQNLQVNFQGENIALGRIMDAKFLEGGFLQYVLTSPTIQIGEALPKCNGIYIPRTLSKRIVVDVSVLNSNDKFFFCGIKENDLKFLIAKARGQNNLDEQWYSQQKHRFNIKSPEELEEAISGFKCCAEKLSEGPVHFLKVIDDTLYWMHSHGSTDNLFGWPHSSAKDDCDRLIKTVRCWRAKEEDLVGKEFQRVIVAGEPGSGKTALLRKVASNMKELYPHRWIINVNINKQSEILKKMKELVGVTRESVLELLIQAASLGDSELAKQLLKYYVSESVNNISILIDAFNETVPTYTETVLRILSILKNLGLSTLWVASRYNVKEKLEIELESKAFNIEPLSDEEQFDFFSQLWEQERAKEIQKNVLNEIPFWDGFPLHIKMICKLCQDLDLSDTSTLFNVTDLYDNFVKMKLKIYFDEVHSNSPSAQIDIIREQAFEPLMKRLMRYSLIELDILENLFQSPQRSIKEKIHKIWEAINKGEIRQAIEEGRENSGIIDRVVDGKPHFIHRAFAEHFAGKWLAKHHKGNEALIRLSFYASWLKTVYKSFCQELARELPAHLAVLNGDISALEELKEEDLNKTDDLGRTPLHLAAQKGGKGARQVVLKLLEYGPMLEITDKLFQFTPLYYAAEAESWDVVRILLKRGAHVTGKEIERRKEFVEAMEDAGRLRDLKPAKQL